jgi:hypothetical protein
MIIYTNVVVSFLNNLECGFIYCLSIINDFSYIILKCILDTSITHYIIFNEAKK